MRELAKIHKYVNLSLGISVEKNTRERPYAEGRFLFFAIARGVTNLSLSTIGGYFGKDHATVLHGDKVFNSVLLKEHRYNKLYNIYIDKKWIDPQQEKMDMIDKLRIEVSELESENLQLEIDLAKKLDFIDGFYKLTEDEQKTVKIRMKAIIKMMPSNQKRKEEYEIINCAT